jgi:hypothetical protein
MAFDGSATRRHHPHGCEPSGFTRPDVEKYWRRLSDGERKSTSHNEMSGGESGIRDGHYAAVSYSFCTRCG